MEHLWAPWRMEFILNEKPTDCILCQKPAEKDDEGNLILHRGKLNFVMLNKYPYNPGHLMVAPYRHIATLEDMSDDEILDHFTMVRKCTKALRSMLEPAGFNIGINLGKIAGAGIREPCSHPHCASPGLGTPISCLWLPMPGCCPKGCPPPTPSSREQSREPPSRQLPLFTSHRSVYP